MQTHEMSVLRVDRGITQTTVDTLAVEEPLEIRLGERPVSVTLRTPGHDEELATGFLFTEGIVRRWKDVESIRHWGSANTVRVRLHAEADVDLQRLERHFYATSSCGVCGRTSLDAVRIFAEPLAAGPVVPDRLIASLPDLLRNHQPSFAATGGVHGAAVFDAAGTLLVAREDIGRHNAVDKAAGFLLMQGITGAMLVVSGRTSFEIVQKCVLMRVPLLVAVGAPSNLAVELAREFNLTLVGFARDERFTIYSGAERILRTV